MTSSVCIMLKTWRCRTFPLGTGISGATRIHKISIDTISQSILLSVESSAGLCPKRHRTRTAVSKKPTRTAPIGKVTARIKPSILCSGTKCEAGPYLSSVNSELSGGIIEQLIIIKAISRFDIVAIAQFRVLCFHLTAYGKFLVMNTIALSFYSRLKLM